MHVYSSSYNVSKYCLNIILLSLQMLSYYSKSRFYLLKENELGRVLDTLFTTIINLVFWARTVCSHNLLCPIFRGLSSRCLWVVAAFCIVGVVTVDCRKLVPVIRNQDLFLFAKYLISNYQIIINFWFFSDHFCLLIINLLEELPLIAYFLLHNQCWLWFCWLM